MRWANDHGRRQATSAEVAPRGFLRRASVGDTRRAIRFLIGAAALLAVGGIALICFTSAVASRAIGVLFLFWACGSVMGAYRFLRGEA
jgi:hypothetical protein